MLELLPVIPPISVTDAAFSVVSKSVREASAPRIFSEERLTLLSSGVVFTKLRLTQFIMVPLFSPAMPPAECRPFTVPPA